MTFEGRVENGAIVLESPIPLPEGARVRIEVIAQTGPTVIGRPKAATQWRLKSSHFEGV